MNYVVIFLGSLLYYRYFSDEIGNFYTMNRQRQMYLWHQASQAIRKAQSRMMALISSFIRHNVNKDDEQATTINWEKSRWDTALSLLCTEMSSGLSSAYMMRLYKAQEVINVASTFVDEYRSRFDSEGVSQNNEKENSPKQNS